MHTHTRIAKCLNYYTHSIPLLSLSSNSDEQLSFSALYNNNNNTDLPARPPIADMAVANMNMGNQGLNPAEVITGKAAGMIVPADVQTQPDTKDKKVINDYMDAGRGEFCRWVARECSNGVMVKRWKQAVGMTAAWPGTWKDTKSVQKDVAITIVCAVNPVDYREGIFEEREMKEATDAVVRQGFMYELSINDDTALPHLYKHPSRQCWTLLGLQDKERAGAIWKYPWSNGRMGVEPPTAEVILDFWKFQEWGKYILGPKQNCAPTDGAPHNRVFITQSLLRHPEPLYVDIPMLHPDAPDPDVKWIQGWACEAKLAKDGFFEGIPVHPMFTVKYGEALTADFITKSPLPTASSSRPRRSPRRPSQRRPNAAGSLLVRRRAATVRRRPPRRTSPS
jgi:hypothetical protein